MGASNNIAPASYWLLPLVAACVRIVTMGARQSRGLFVSPLNTTTGLRIAAIIFFWMHASRAWLISVYLLAPKTELTFYLFAAGPGLIWLGGLEITELGNDSVMWIAIVMAALAAVTNLSIKEEKISPLQKANA